MRIGAMRHKVMVMHKTITQNAVGEQESVLEDMFGLRCTMDFLKTEDSDSKFSALWANRLVMKTRYSLPLMDSLNNKNSFKIRWQDNLYKIHGFESWNNLQKYITVYLEKDI
ncbi:head-tail adaptor protein [Aeromonas salmonicida]|uniref:phage head completion protein n=1 Tax=Aeromonas salmonicida TaxID=645 RepID=UPI003B508CCB